MESVIRGVPKDGTEAEYDAYLKQLCSDVTLQSRTDGFFALWLDQIKSNIGGNFVKRFSQLRSDEERILLLWSVSFQPLHGLKVMRFFKEKNGELSDKKRNDGNEAFHKKELQNALSLYSQAVTKAPLEGNMLNYAYANRSAILFHMKLYKYCLTDIQLALEHGYPENLQYKVLERRGCCYQRQGCFQKAIEAFKSALEKVSSSELEEKKLKSWRITTEKKIKECENEEGKDLRPEADEKIPVIGGPAPKLDLFEGVSKIFPNASSAFGVESSANMGRYGVALKDIPAGKMIISEPAYATVLEPEKGGGYCITCMHKLTSPIPCPRCSGVAFCCVECRDVALNSFHKYECEFGDFLYATGMSINVSLAFRIITQHGLEHFQQWKKNSKPLTDAVPSAAQPFQASSYSSIQQMVALESDRDTFDFLQRTLMAILLLKVLQRAHYFRQWDDDVEPDENLTEDEVFIGTLLLRNLQVIQFNAHEFSGMTFFGSLKNLPFKTSKSIFLGLAIYPTISFLNHSCVPTVARHFDNRSMNLVSIRPIRKGEIISENYGPVFTRQPFDHRQKKLLSRYWFTCRCEACEGRWPVYDEWQQTLRFKCIKCGTLLPAPPQTSGSKKDVTLPCPECGKVTDAAATIMTLVEAQKFYKEGRKAMDNGLREEAINSILKYVQLAGSVICLPYKDIHLCVDALRLLVCARGTSFRYQLAKK